MVKKLLKPEVGVLFVVTSVLFFNLIIAFNNTLAHDDYLFLDVLNKHGFTGSIVYWYYSWQGRISAYVLTNLTLFAERYTNGLFIYFFLLASLFISGIYFLFINTFKRLGITYNTKNVLLFAAYIFVFFQEIVYDKSTIFWIAASASYYAGLGFLITGFALLLSKKSGFLMSSSLFIIFFIVGSSLESLAFISFFIISAYYGSTYFFVTAFFNGNDRKKIIFSLLGLGTGIAVIILCPGLEHRRASFPKPDIISAIIISANSLYHFYKFILVPELGKIILFSSPFIYFGHTLKSLNPTNELKFFMRTILVILFFLITIIVLNFLIMAKGTGGMGQPRTLFLLSFFIALFFSVIAFLCGYTSQVSRSVSLLFSYVTIGFFLISISQNYLKTLPESIRYSKSEKSRMDLIHEYEKTGRTETLVLDTLYYNKHVIYRSNELSPQTDGIWNKAVRDAENLHFDLKVKYNVSYDNEAK